MAILSCEIEDILEKSLNNERLSSDECLKLFSTKELTSLGIAADAVCKRKHPEDYRTYIIDRILITQISVHRVVNFAPFTEKLNIAMVISFLKILCSGKLKKRSPWAEGKSSCRAVCTRH